MKRILTILALLIILPSAACAANIYVSPGGGGSCTESSPCSLSTANSNVQAGDTVYMRGGTYSTAIQPSRSGTSNANRITYQAYDGETVNVVTGMQNYGLRLMSKDWIKVDGINFYASYPLWMEGSSYNLIQNCVFDGHSYNYGYVGNAIRNGCTYNKFYGDTFIESGTGDTLRVGYSGQTDDGTEYNYFYQCLLEWGTHSIMSVNAPDTIVKDCNFRQDMGQGYDASSRPLGIGGAIVERGLIEGNRIAWAYTDLPGACGFQLRAPNYIVRRNMFYANGNSGTQLVGQYTIADHNRFYNNVYYQNGLNTDIYSCWRYPISIAQWGTTIPPDDNVFKNEVMYQNGMMDSDGICTDGSVGSYSTANLWTDSNGNPQFTDGALPSNHGDFTKPDFTPLPTSGLIDNGVYLTQADGSGSNSYSLKVHDDLYFFDASPWDSQPWMDVPAEYVYVAGWPAPVRVTSINRQTHTLTLASAQSWNNNAGVYSAVSSAVGFYGSAPDQGPIEYTSNPVYSCTGSIPANAAAYDPEESTGLIADVQWTYSATDTARKCEYRCNTGYIWDVSACVQQQTTNPIAYWNFDEGTGTAAHDSSGNSNEGTLANGPIWTTGKIGTHALSFDGVNDYVQVPDSASLNPSYITFSMWFNPRSFTDNSGLIAKGDSSSRQYWAWIFHGNLSLEINEGGHTNYIYPLQENTWYFLAVTYDGTNIVTYINGDEVSTISQSSGTMLTSSNPLYIGTLPGYASFNGSIDDVRVYGYALTAQEVRSLYLGTEGLVLHLPLDGDAQDISGNGNDGTLINGPAWTAGRVGTGALSFDGVDDYVDTGDLDAASGLTLSAWVNPAKVAVNQRIISKWEGSYVLSTDNNQADRFTFAIIDASGGMSICDSDASGTYDAGEWAFVAGTYNGTACRIFVNGIDRTYVSMGSANGKISDTAFTTKIGIEGSDSSLRAFEGRIDDVRIYSRVLSAEQIAALANPHRADTSGDGCVDDPELMAFIGRFYLDSTAYPMGELMEAVGLWKSGAGC